MNMKKILGGSLFAMGMVMLAACGSSSSSASDNDSETLSAVIDEEAQTISLLRNISSDFCVRSENNTYTWKEVQMYDDTLVWGYKFANDTLIVIKNPGSSYEYGMVLTGGTAGKLYGTWTQSNYCEYEDNEIDCDDEPNSTNYTYQYKFTKSSVTGKKIILVDDEEIEEEEYVRFDDYMNSSFMNDFFYSLYMEEEFDLSIWGLGYEDSTAVMSYSLIYPVSSKSKNKMTFTVNDNKVTVSMDEFNYDEDSEEVSLKLSVASGTQTCALEYASVYEMSSKYCKAENADYFDIDETDDAYGYEFSYVDEYEKNTEDEFNDCLNMMFFGISKAQVLYKTSATSVDHKKLGKVSRDFYKAVKNLKK
jgi:hypothetical protein